MGELIKLEPRKRIHSNAADSAQTDGERRIGAQILFFSGVRYVPYVELAPPELNAGPAPTARRKKRPA